MNFFTTFYTFIQNSVLNMVSAVTNDISASIAPALVTFATIYVMIWGYLHLRGAIEEPVMEGAKRILLLAVILAVCLDLWEYNAVFIDFFVNTPTALSGAILGGTTAMTTVDGIWGKGATVADSLLTQGGFFDGNIGFFLAAFLVYILTGFICAYMVYLFVLSLVAVGLLLAVGPMFVMALLFEATKRFFEAWIAQLSNYALIIVLASIASKLMLNYLDSYATQTSNLGAGVTIADSAQFCVACGITLLIMKQVPHIAAGLGSGVALSTYSTLSRAVNWGKNTASGSLYQTARGFGDAASKQDPSRYLSTTRNMANRVARPIVNRFSRGEEKTGGKIARK
ncbi:MAG: type IV secretion system protein [Methyloglobulus sp.]|nr:type IV secretion system protein [Methyloglobulus sp.]